MVREHKGHWQNVKWTCPRNPNKESEPYLTYCGRKFKLNDFTNWGGASEHYTYQEGHTVYYVELDECGDRGRITYCPPSW